MRVKSKRWHPWCVELSRRGDQDEVNAAFKAASEGPLKGLPVLHEDQIVSSDIVGSPASCTFDSSLTDGVRQPVKVIGWYDNEWVTPTASSTWPRSSPSGCG